MRTILIAATALLAGYAVGFVRAERRCEADALRAELNIVRFDLLSARNSEDRAKSQAAELEESDRLNQGKISELVEKLGKRPHRNCGLSDGDARSLRAIR